MARNRRVNDPLTTPPKVVSTSVTARSSVPVWLMAVLLVSVTIALYWPATRHDFVNYDDNVYLLENPQVSGGLTWEGVKWAFRNTAQAAYWAPLMWLSHQLACQFFGLNAWGHHLINVLLHGLNTLLVFLLLYTLTRLCRDAAALGLSKPSVPAGSVAPAGAFWLSMLAAALFGWHPLRVESVAWVTERKDVLSTFFGLLSLIFYARYAHKRKHPTANARGWYWLSLLMLACGLMSKPMLVTWPFVMLLLDYWPLNRFPFSAFRFQLLKEKLPFLALAAAASVVTFVVQQQGGAVIAVRHLPLGARVGNALISYCHYLGKMFWPTDLAVFYPHPGYWPLGRVLLAGGLLVGISLLFFVRRRSQPFFLMGWLWYVGTLVPVIGLAQSGEQALADRFTYIPSLGVLIILIWGAHELVGRWRHQVMVLSMAGLAAIVVCLVLTRQQLGHWRDSEALFRHALAVTENNYFVQNNLGIALLEKGQIAGATRHFQEALRLKPDYPEAHYNLGNIFLGRGRIDEGIRHYQEALRLNPADSEAHNNLGGAFATKGRIDEAIGHFQEAVRLKPDNATARRNLAAVLALKGGSAATSPPAMKPYTE